MKQQSSTLESLLVDLQERAKELNCLYAIEEVLSESNLELEVIFKKIVGIIPPGFQYSHICKVRIAYRGRNYELQGLEVTPWSLKSEIIYQGKQLGAIWAYYNKRMPDADEGPFLKEERRLMNTIADRIAHYIFYQTIKPHFEEVESKKKKLEKTGKDDWKVILDLLRATDQKLYFRISRKMMNYLVYNGVEEATQLLQDLGSKQGVKEDIIADVNKPRARKTIGNLLKISGKSFQIAAENISNAEISQLVQKWIIEDKSIFLFQVLENQNASMSDIADALTRFVHAVPNPEELPESVRKGVSVSLIRRFFTDQLEYINVAKEYIKIKDFSKIIKKIIHIPKSHGKVGGKSSGLFLAYQILKRNEDGIRTFKNIKTPMTWYITSDALSDFLHYNNLADVLEQKYKPVDQVRLEHPHIEQVFKNSFFQPEIIRGLTRALEDFGDGPLIVRSSSLLEDRMGSAFSGKYKSLFIPNIGTFEERLEQLSDAVAEVYASTFGPDPIEYRAQMGLLDFNEEMGIMIMKVVGKQLGKYFMPAYAGVAFSNNEFRWSPRIGREDGLVRMVPGLGTRAVDRVGDDYPVLIAPGQPGLRVNVTAEEVMRYAPKYMDVINLETKTFETIDVDGFLKEFGEQCKFINQYVSQLKDGHLSRPIGLNVDFNKDDFVYTFEGLISNSPFVKQVKYILKTLQEKLNFPVDIEFASDGEDFYLLQCRPQCYSIDDVAMEIPKNIPEDKVVFSANRFVSNGLVQDITHIVYVVPEVYSEVENLEKLNEIGKIIGKLNKLLPKKHFILMGPGRWGSRGDIKLGVKITYADINNTAMLIEIARKKGNYKPDLSFGTHFFQDLVEASIRYLPLYPDEKENHFNDSFLLEMNNELGEILPECKDFSDVVKVIDVRNVTDGDVLKVLLNADQDKAVAFVSPPGDEDKEEITKLTYGKRNSKAHWRWRMQMANSIAEKLDQEKFGVKDIYLIGSVKNATAGPGSDIDILIHFRGNKNQKVSLVNWLNGWNGALSEANYIRTGLKYDDILDVHFITDDDIKNKTSYGIKINAITDPAKKLPMV